MKYALLAGGALAALMTAPGAYTVIAQEVGDTPIVVVGTPKGDQAEATLLARPSTTANVIEAGEDGEIALPADQFAAVTGMSHGPAADLAGLEYDGSPVAPAASGGAIIQAGEDGEIALPAAQYAAQFGDHQTPGQAVIVAGEDGEIALPADQFAAQFGMTGQTPVGAVMEAGEDGEIALPADQFAVGEVEGEAILEAGEDGEIALAADRFAPRLGLNSQPPAETVIAAGEDGEIALPADQFAALVPPTAAATAARERAGLWDDRSPVPVQGDRLDQLAAMPVEEDEAAGALAFNLGALADPAAVATWEQTLTPAQTGQVNDRCGEMSRNDPNYDDDIQAFCDSWAIVAAGEQDDPQSTRRPMASDQDS